MTIRISFIGAVLVALLVIVKILCNCYARTHPKTEEAPKDYAGDMRCETCRHCITMPQACYCDKHIICTKPDGFCDYWVSLDGKHEWLADPRCTPSWKRRGGIDLAAEYSKYKRAIIEEELFMKGFMDEGR